MNASPRALDLRWMPLASRLIEDVLRFERPLDTLLSEVLRSPRLKPAPGSRERAALSDAVFALVRRLVAFRAQAERAPEQAGTLAQRLAWLVWPGRHTGPLPMPESVAAWLRDADAALASSEALPAEQQHNLPSWLATRLQAQLGQAGLMQLGAALQQPAGLTVRVNVARARRAAVRALLEVDGLSSEPTQGSPWGLRLPGRPHLTTLPAYQDGLVEVQDEGSQMLALLVDPRRQDVVCDFCAGAGGKTLAMAAAMRDQGRVYALDNSAHRLEALRPRLERAGLRSVYPMAIAHEDDERVRRMSGKVDRVLVDAPCSGLGTLRRSPDLKWRQTPETVAAHAQVQLRILQSAARLLRPGGRLVYATCSLLEEENESVAAAFDAAQSGFRAEPVQQVLEHLRVEQAPQWCTPDGRFLRLWPHRHPTDGFFAAIWSRLD